MTARPPFARMLLAVLFLCGLSLAARPVGAQNPAHNLFGAEQTLAPAPANPLALRARGASLNLAEVEQARRALAAGQAPAALSLNLFADTQLVAHWERVDAALGGYSLAGTIAGSPYSEIHLSVSGGAFFASLNSAQGLFEITAPDGKTSQIVQLDPSRFPNEDETVPTLPVAQIAAQPDVAVGPGSVDDGTRIDVYVGYTTAAKNARGGQATLLSMINTAISETNTGYANSGISQRVVLVGADEYAYDDTALNWNAALSNWSNPGDPVFSPAHTLRQINKADEMVLLVSDPVYCGLGYLMTTPSVGFASFAFSVVAQGCTTGYYSFAHEMGHNMGAHHDRYSAGASQVAFPYAYGFWINNPATGHFDWRTIMAYNVPISYGYNATRVNYWSNPNINYNGEPTGKIISDPASAYNALVLNNTAPFVAQFRDGAAPAAPGGLVASLIAVNSAQLNWSFSGSDVWLFRIERASLAAEDWAQIGSVPAAQLSYSDATFVSGSSVRYRVLADNGNGRSASNIAVPIFPIFPAPSGLAVTPSAPYTAKLDWSNNSSLADALVVQRALTGSASWANITSLSSTAVSYTDPAVPDGRSYQYQVVASYNASPFASNVATLVALPATPAGLTLTGLGSSSVQLDWSLASGAQDSLLIERKPLSGTFSMLSMAAANALTFTDTTLPASADTQYRVVAHNARGDMPSSTVTLPAAPANLRPVYPAAAPHTIELAWSDASNAETGYSLETSSNGGTDWALAASPSANAHAYSHNTGSCSQTRQYRLRAVAAASQSAAVTAAAVTQPCAPVLTVITSSSSAFLFWPAVGAGATYNVYQWSSDSYYLLTQPALPAQTTLYILHNLIPNSSYQFYVQAVNAAGTAQSPAVTITTKTWDYFVPRVQR